MPHSKETKTYDKQNFYLPHEKQIFEYIKTIDHLKKQNQNNPLFTAEIRQLEDKLEKLQKKVYRELTAWERVLISRHPQRPHAIDYVQGICEDFVELFGDRTFGEDPSIIGGFATIDGTKCMFIGQEKGGEGLRRGSGG